jgi:hypothetical protein
MVTLGDERSLSASRKPEFQPLSPQLSATDCSIYQQLSFKLVASARSLRFCEAVMTGDSTKLYSFGHRIRNPSELMYLCLLFSVV